MDLYEMDIANFKPQLIYKNEKGYAIGPISDDRKQLSLIQSITTNDNDLFIYELDSKKMTKVNERLCANRPQAFSEDHQSLFYTTDAGAEFAYLMKYNIKDGSQEKVIERDWDVTGSYTTDRGSYRVSYLNEDAKNTIEVTEIASNTKLALPDFGSQSITNIGFSADESKLRLFVGGSNTPSNLYVYDLQTKALTQLTETLSKEVDIADMVTAKVIRYPSFDGTEIPAIYYLPKQASEAAKVPALVWVHGGPGGQSR